MLLASPRSTLALAAVTAFAQYTTEPAEVALLAELVPPMVGVARTCLTNGEEEEACSVFAILLEIIELPVPVLQVRFLFLLLFWKPLILK